MCVAYLRSLHASAPTGGVDGEDGRNAEAEMFCPKCGAQSEYGKFCRACGTNLAAVSEVIEERPQGQLAAPSSGGLTLGLFSSAAIANDTRELAGHKTAAIFGKVTIDLTGALLPVGETRISAYTIFGDVEILVPNDVGLRVTGISALSGVKIRGEAFGNGFFHVDEYRSPNYAQATRRLHMEIASFFSGLKIRR